VHREYSFDEGEYRYCWAKGTENWNPVVVRDVAVFGLDETPGVQAWSITGFIFKDFDDNKDRHGSRFNLKAKNKYPRPYWVNTVAHELGHVIGFWHVR